MAQVLLAASSRKPLVLIFTCVLSFYRQDSHAFGWMYRVDTEENLKRFEASFQHFYLRRTLVINICCT